MSAGSSKRIGDQPCFALYSAVHAITKAYRPLLEPLALTYPQYVVMMLLWEEDGLDVQTIARRARLESPTLTPVLKRLESKGLLSRTRAVDDERRLVVRLTEEGRALHRQAAHVPEAILCQVGLDPEGEVRLRELCGQIWDTLQTASPGRND